MTIASTDAVQGWDAYCGANTWVVSVSDWQKPAPEVTAGLLLFPEFSSAEFG